MDEKPQNTSKINIDTTLYDISKKLMRRGYSDAQVRQFLIEKGLTSSDAYIIVRRITEEKLQNHGKKVSRAKRNSAFVYMVIGGAIFGYGVFATVSSYEAASNLPFGGEYTIHWGAMAVGGILFLRGLTQLVNF